MGIPAISLRFLLSLVLLGELAAPGAAEDSHAVAGTTRDRTTGKPLESVKVEVLGTSIEDLTRSGDGAFVLSIPASFRTFDLQYSKNGYLDLWDLGVSNTMAQQKRPIVRMRPKSGIKALPPEEIEGLVDDAVKALEHARDLKSSAAGMLRRSVRRNLVAIHEATIGNDKLGDTRTKIKNVLDKIGSVDEPP
jgi:hypothetical protein